MITCKRRIMRKSVDAGQLRRTSVSRVRDEKVVDIQLVDEAFVDAPPHVNAHYQRHRTYRGR